MSEDTWRLVILAAVVSYLPVLTRGLKALIGPRLLALSYRLGRLTGRMLRPH